MIHQLYQVPTISVVADVADPHAPQSTLETVERKLGHIDILVNNAGIDKFNTLEHEVSFDSWWRVMEVNFRGPAAFTHAVLPGMLSRRHGQSYLLAVEMQS